MVQKEKYQQLNAEYYKQEKFWDVVTKRKISKHISDITDTITEEDIKNVKTDFGTAVSIIKTEETITSTWNVLES